MMRRLQAGSRGGVKEKSFQYIYSLCPRNFFQNELFAFRPLHVDCHLSVSGLDFENPGADSEITPDFYLHFPPFLGHTTAQAYY